MYPILVAALRFFLIETLKAVVIKFVVFTVISLIVLAFMPLIGAMLPRASGISSLMNAIPPSVWYFIDMFQLTLGLKLAIAALATRFIIRRIPVVG